MHNAQSLFLGDSETVAAIVVNTSNSPLPPVKAMRRYSAISRITDLFNAHKAALHANICTCCRAIPEEADERLQDRAAIWDASALMRHPTTTSPMPKIPSKSGAPPTCTAKSSSLQPATPTLSHFNAKAAELGMWQGGKSQAFSPFGKLCSNTKPCL